MPRPVRPGPVEFIERTAPVSAPPKFALRNWLPRWFAGRRAVWLTATMLVAGIAAAAIALQQDVTTTSASQDSDVKFTDGGGGLAGFATNTIDSSGASATISLTGVAGAALSVTDLLTLTNSDATQDYSVTLSRSAAPNGAITKLEFVVKNDAEATVETFDAATTATGSAFTVSATKAYDISVNMDVADGTAVGSLGSITLQFTLVPV